MKHEGYYVIGGQYYKVCYGHADTLHQAKLLATKYMEYWDNWQGWHTPEIFRAEDCYEVSTYGFPYEEDMVIVNQAYALPVAYKSNGKWKSMDFYYLA